MKIYVCIKQIPDPNTVVSNLDPATKRLVRSGVSLVLDPGDESTISAAIKLRDTLGNSEVIAVSMGPSSAQEAMRRALAMGVDSAILVTDPALAGSDALSTARVLAATLKKFQHPLFGGAQRHGAQRPDVDALQPVRHAIEEEEEIPPTE